jgi:hypothetical protein
MKECPRKYQLKIIEGWQPNKESVHLRFGSEVHTVAEGYAHSRAAGINHEDSVHDAIQALVDRVWDWEPIGTEKALSYKNRDTLLSLCVDFLDYYQDDPAETFIKENGRPAVELTFAFSLEFGPESSSEPYLLCGHLDRVVNFNGALMVMDHKTATQTLGSYYFDQFEPNNQMSLYTLAGQVVLKAQVRGVIIDAAQVMLEEPNRFVRGFTYRTPDQLNEWLADLKALLKVFEGYALAEYWPMNDTSCDKFGGCQFRGICSKDPSVRERFLRADFTQQPENERWNPLRPR